MRSLPKEIAPVVWLALVLLSPHRFVAAATLTNYLGFVPGTMPFWYNLAINAGDTLVWVQPSYSYQGTNQVESYGGEFKSPPLAPGDVFSYTFTNPGNYAYRAGLFHDSPAGTVAVAAWTNAPPAITLNSPVQGAVIPSSPWPVLATVATAENVAEIEYYANSALVGVSTNAAVGIWWSYDAAGQAAYVLQARAVYRQGGDAWSQPITVWFSPSIVLYGARVLPTGQFLVSCSLGFGPPDVGSFQIARSESPLLTNATNVVQVYSSGVFVDEGLPGAGLGQAFYALIRSFP